MMLGNALHCAASGGHLEVVKYLIEDRECDPKISDNDGLNALHCAAYNGHLKVVRVSIEDRKCDLNIRENNGSNALHLATMGI